MFLNPGQFLFVTLLSSWSGDQGIQPILTSSEEMCCKIGPHYLERFNNHRELIQSQKTELEGDTKNYKNFVSRAQASVSSLKPLDDDSEHDGRVPQIF